MFLDWLLNVGLPSGVLGGASGWLFSTWKDRIARNEQHALNEILLKLKKELEATNAKYNSELNKGLFVHELQHKARFEAYKAVWDSLGILKDEIKDFLAENWGIYTDYNGQQLPSCDCKEGVNQIIYKFMFIWNSPYVDDELFDIFLEISDIYTNAVKNNIKIGDPEYLNYGFNTTSDIIPHENRIKEIIRQQTGFDIKWKMLPGTGTKIIKYTNSIYNQHSSERRSSARRI